MRWFDYIPKIEYIFLDRDNTEASLDLYYGDATDLDSLWAAVQSETRGAAISDCTLIGQRMILGALADQLPEPTGSNLAFGYITCITAAGDHVSIAIPGIRADLLVATGCFTDMRLDMLHADVLALRMALTASEIVTPRGDLVVDLTSGGIMNFWTDLDTRSG